MMNNILNMFGRKESWINKHLIAYFPYNNNPDDVVQGITPTSTAIDYDAGYHNQAVKFNGTTNKYIYYPSEPFTFTDGISDKPFTIFGWFYFDDFNNRFFINKRDTQDNNLEYQMFVYNNNLGFSVFGSDKNKYIVTKVNTSNLQSNSWVHIIASFNTQEVSLYINGIEQSDSYSNNGYDHMIISNSKLAIGNPRWSGGYNFKGIIDGLGFLNIAVDGSKAIKLYQKHTQEEIKD